MLLRKTPLSKKLTSEDVENKLKDVVSVKNIVVSPLCHVTTTRLSYRRIMYLIFTFQCLHYGCTDHFPSDIVFYNVLLNGA